MSLLDMARGLSEAGVRFVVIGGVAGAAHGSVRITEDLDICYAVFEENLRCLANLLTSWSAYLRDAEPGLPFIMDETTLRNTEILTLTTDHGEIDVFQRVQGVGEYSMCLARSGRITVGDFTVHVLGLEALIDAKRALGRPKDIEHLRELEALLELKKERR